MFRKIVLILAILVVAAPLGACGKKGSVKNPPDTTYPRKYPSK